MGTRPFSRPLLAGLLGWCAMLSPIGFAQDGEEAQAEEEGQRKVISFRPGPSADTISFTEKTEGYSLENATVQASARTAIIFYEGRGPYVGTTLRNVLITVEPDTLELDRSLWAIRGYDMIDTLLEDVEITGFGKVTSKHDEGHAIYLNMAGDLTLRGCNIHHNGGQGIQLVNRPNESVLPSGPAAGKITIEKTKFRSNGFNPDRGSYQVSIFGTGQEVRIEDVSIYAGFDETVWPGGRTTGALLIEAEAFDPRRPEKPVWWRPRNPPETFQIPFSQGKTELIDVRVRLRRPDRPIVAIKGCKELIVRNCTFEGGAIQLDDPAKPGRSCGSIVWEGNTGSAPVYHKGQLQGLAHHDFTYEAQ